jgi:heme O synthase-like polyprenyltransferase
MLGEGGASPWTCWLCWLAWKFRVHRERAHARKLFFCTLMYLPAALILSVIAWKR